MTDSERVLMNIALDTSGSVFDIIKRLSFGWSLRFRSSGDIPRPQFIPEEMAERINMPLKNGDIVRCVSNPHHDWGISELVSHVSSSRFLLRQIGGKKILDMQNESVDVLRFMYPHRLYTGHKFRIYKLASEKAFMKRYNPEADRYKRCGGVAVSDDTLTIWSRAHVFCSEKSVNNVITYANPRKFTLKWNNKTKLSDIVAAMIEQGFGSSFEYVTEEPSYEQDGYLSIGSKDLENILEMIK